MEDWTVNDVNTLVRYVQSGPSNTPATLYVATEDAAKHVCVVCSLSGLYGLLRRLAPDMRECVCFETRGGGRIRTDAYWFCKPTP